MSSTPETLPTAATHIQIQAPIDVVYRLAAEVEFWPTFVRDAASVRVLRRAPNGQPERLIEIAGRGWRPVRVRLVQRLEPEYGRISYRVPGQHTGNPLAEWTLTASDDGAATDVLVTQSATAPFPRATLGDLRHVAEGGTLAEGR